MAMTLSELEKRLTQVEQEIVHLRQLVEQVAKLLPGVKPFSQEVHSIQQANNRLDSETPAERGARLLREASLYQAEIATGWAKAMEQMGIKGEPIGAEKVQEMIAACGIKPEDNEFSRGIIEMREE